MGNGLMDTVQKPEGIASLAGTVVGGKAGGSFGSKVLKPKAKAAFDAWKAGRAAKTAGVISPKKPVFKPKNEVPKGKSPNGKSTGGANSVDDILQGAKDTTRKIGKAKNFEKTGGYQQALDDFNSMQPSNTKPISTKYGEGMYGTLPDGTTLSLRPWSETGGATLEIKVPGEALKKIRY